MEKYLKSAFSLSCSIPGSDRLTGPGWPGFGCGAAALRPKRETSAVLDLSTALAYVRGRGCWPRQRDYASEIPAVPGAAVSLRSGTEDRSRPTMAAMPCAAWPWPKEASEARISWPARLHWQPTGHPRPYASWAVLAAKAQGAVPPDRRCPAIPATKESGNFRLPPGPRHRDRHCGGTPYPVPLGCIRAISSSRDAPALFPFLLHNFVQGRNLLRRQCARRIIFGQHCEDILRRLDVGKLQQFFYVSGILRAGA